MEESNQQSPMPENLDTANERVEAVLVGFNELAIELIKCMKQGSPSADIAKFVEDMKSNQELQAKMLDAELAIRSLPADLKEIGLFGEAKLAWVQLQFISRILEAIKA